MVSTVIGARAKFWQTFGRPRLRFVLFLPRESDFSSRFGLCLQLQERIRAVRSVLKHLDTVGVRGSNPRVPTIFMPVVLNDLATSAGA